MIRNILLARSFSPRLAFLVLLSVLASPCFGQMIYENNFDQYTYTHRYRVNDLNADWNNPDWSQGVKEGRVKIRNGYKAYGHSGSCLELKSPSKKYGPSKSFASWKMDLGGTYTEAYCGYHVKFKKGFDFVKGGKLPGLAGGSAPTGWTYADGFNGWAARLMWRTSFTGTPGKPKQKSAYMISYAKFVDCGPDGDGKIEDQTPFTDSNGQLISIEANRWYEIVQRVRMNDVGLANGIIEIWIDGELAVGMYDIEFRKREDLGIDLFYFSTFFGGGKSWRCSKYETMYMDNFWIMAMP